MKIAHISDLHFGAASDQVTRTLHQTLTGAGLDLVIASGDITQSATVAEFEQAKAFFAALPVPVFCIPGNHDLPGMDLSRFLTPWARYKHYLGDDLEPEFKNDIVHVKGINTARRILPHWNWANGSISRRQCRDITETYRDSTAPWRIFVMHHPVMNAREMPLDVALFHRNRLLRCLDQSRIDLVLAGHQHHAYIENRETNGHTTLFLNASTAMSLRIRRQPNGFNLLDISETALRIDRLELQGDTFRTVWVETHAKPAAPLPSDRPAIAS